MTTHQTFQAELRELYRMLAWIREGLVKAGLSDVEVRRIEVALEEGLVNVISYAYQGEKGTIEIQLHIEKEDFVEIQLIDTGHPFNPLNHKRIVDPFTPVEELEEGGLGILFMQKLMDQVTYERIQEKNILTLRKSLP